MVITSLCLLHARKKPPKGIGKELNLVKGDDMCRRHHVNEGITNITFILKQKNSETISSTFNVNKALKV